jgi:hypothetical protein
MQFADHAFIERRHFEHNLLGFVDCSVQVWNAQLRPNCQCRRVTVNGASGLTSLFNADNIHPLEIVQIDILAKAVSAVLSKF